jgi:mono/diheme cytochrome c family protein
MKAFLLAAVVQALLPVAGHAQAADPAPPPAGDAAKGREQFATYKCTWCHGTEGQGGLAAVGPRIALVPRSLESFIGYVRKPTTRMSAYAEASVSDEVLRDIYAYLRQLPQAKPAAEVPLLNQIRTPKGR